MTSFHDIHRNEVGEYESSTGDEHDSENYTKNSEVSVEYIHLED